MFWHAWQWLPCYWVLPLEMLFTCTCYSRLHWRCFGYVSSSYCTIWSSLALARFRFLLDHMSGPFLFHMSVFYWHTYRVAIGSRVTSSLDQVSYFYGPHGVTTILCVSFFYSTTCLDVVRPRVSILLGHVSHPELPTFLFLIRPCGRMDLYHVFCLYWPTCPVLALTHVIHWFVHVSNSYLTTCLCWIYHVHTNHYIRKMILDLHYCTK